MIEALQLTRRFGSVQAVDGVSLRVEKGELVGLLGPNGAGKTTTMRLLTGALLPNSGRASVGGFDVVERSLESRQQLGYLPENNPIYPDTTVEHHLAFIAKVRGLAKEDAKSAIDRVLSQLELKQYFKRPIGTLSKGLRQRVGLAQALLHNPPVLILDEPTSGLDPNQAQDARDYIKELAKDKAILWSTHILSEIQAIAHRLYIINQGRVAAEGAPGDLLAGSKGSLLVRVQVAAGASPQAVREALMEMKAVRAVTDHKGHTHGDWLGLSLSASEEEGEDLCAGVFDLCVVKGWRLRHLSTETISLDQVFRDLTRGQGGKA